MAEASSSKSSSCFSPDFNAYNLDIQGAALNATKLAAGLPADIAFHRSMDREFSQALDACSTKVLSLTNRLLTLVATGQSSNSSRSKGKSKLKDQDDVIDNFESVVIDAVDNLLERTDICLDDYLGRSKPAAIEIKAIAKKLLPDSRTRQGRLDPVLTHASHLPKPQLKFNQRVDNTNNGSWRPELRHKYNAKVPLGYNLHTVDEDDDLDALKVPHPYRHEIKHISYPQRMFEHADAIPPRSFEDTPFTWVDTKEALDTMLEKLRGAPELAVDLEHHSYRTFSGFLCLMQISTREEDFVVDTLALRDELEDLNEVFTDPRIIKVLHGAESDIVWLQQDFNLYIVNLFDTFHASKVLAFPRHGLAALLDMYCDFIPDKRYQLADWRIRPLPNEMLQYARSDTHFLLYIYDNVRNALLDRASGKPDLIFNVLDRSTETSLRTYAKEVYRSDTGSGPGGWATLAQKWNKSLTGLQMTVFQSTHAWRDRIAREEDESTRYVLPNHYLFQLAEQPPPDMAALLAIFRPVPSLIRTRAKELLDIIREAVNDHMLNSTHEHSIQQLEQSGHPVITAISSSSSLANTSLAPNVAASSVVVTATALTLPHSETMQPFDSTRLWSNQQTNHSSAAAAASSSLFGAIVYKLRPSDEPYSSTQSTLFPSLGRKAISLNTGTSARYREVVTRIHSALVIAPTVPQIFVDAVNKLTDPASGVNEAISVHMNEPLLPSSIQDQIEIPYIPASHRLQVKADVDDTVVIVGQARQKKRKRPVQQAETGSNESTPPANSEGSSKKKLKKKAKDNTETIQEEEPFDYSSVPNMLDGQPHYPSNGPIRKPPKKGGGIEYGNFPAPPRAHSELKSGNRSHTFR